MDWGNWVTILVAVIAALSAYASQRAAAKATTLNTSTTSRVDMEKEAYDRARKFDIETIERQDAEIAELRADKAALLREIAYADFRAFAGTTPRELLASRAPGGGGVLA